jgi:ribosomal-protein-alanine N-acetyltransferase
MEHKGTQVLETERLLLRPFRAEDAPAAYRNWCSEDAVTRYLTWQTHADAGVTETLMTDWAAGYADPAFYQWAIELKSLGEPIGSISVVHRDEQVNAVSIGYCIGSCWWRQGITTEAFRAVIRYLFEEVGMNRVAARHDPNNPNSGRVMRKCGMIYEGTARSADRNNQGVCDAAHYAILHSDWKK